jgi:hypothetical protein
MLIGPVAPNNCVDAYKRPAPSGTGRLIRLRSVAVAVGAQVFLITGATV